MGYRRRKFSGGRYNYKSRYRNADADQHIREANELSQQLGGTDKDVKSYFFGLSGGNLDEVLLAYGEKYGQDKRDYAESALSEWRSGRRQMSGLVAGRLFELLPKFMPVDNKFALVESLWRFSGPKSHRDIYVGPDVTASNLTSLVRDHLSEKVQSYFISESISNRFTWLAENDSALCQQLENYFLELERQQLSQASFDRISVILKHLQTESTSAQSVTQTFEVGKHSVSIHFNPKFTGVSDKAPVSSSDSWGCGFWLFVIGIVIMFFYFAD